MNGLGLAAPNRIRCQRAAVARPYGGSLRLRGLVVDKLCVRCGAPIPVGPGRTLVRPKRRYCSRSCYLAAPRRGDLASRFRSRVDHDGPVPAAHPELGPCWLWTGTRVPEGYGQISVGGRKRPATHVALELDGRPVPLGQQACHRCDNPPCVRASHLFAGTNAENVADKVAKGRGASGLRSGQYTKPESVLRGEAHGRARLTEADVLAIRRLAADGLSTIAIAARYADRVTDRAIDKVVKRETWRHL
jgi:hypothetical protein